MGDAQDSISDHLKCPICFEIPREKMFQCRNGHRFCEDCFKEFREKVCPQCEDPIPKNPIRCIAVEELLDSFGVEFPCQFQSAGCKANKDRKGIREHNSSCKYDFGKFGPLENVCGLFGFQSCSFQFNRGSIDEALAHFHQEHKMRSIKALLSKQFTIQYENFMEIFNSSEASVFTPLIFDQRWWGHDFIYIIVIRFNPHDKSLQFLPFYLPHGPIACNGPKRFPEQVKFSLEFDETNASMRPQPLLNCDGKTLHNSKYFAFPVDSKIPLPIHSSLQIKISKSNTPQPPKGVQEDTISFTLYKSCHLITPFLLNKRSPPLIRPVSFAAALKNWNKCGWFAWKDFGDCKQRFTSLSTFQGRNALICRANVNAKWLVGVTHFDKMKAAPLRAHFKSPFLFKHEETFKLDDNFEVLYAPPGSVEWARWKDAKGMETVAVHDEDKSLVICEWRDSFSHLIGALERDNVELAGRDDIYVLVVKRKEEEGPPKCAIRSPSKAQTIPKPLTPLPHTLRGTDASALPHFGQANLARALKQSYRRLYK